MRIYFKRFVYDSHEKKKSKIISSLSFHNFDEQTKFFIAILYTISTLTLFKCFHQSRTIKIESLMRNTLRWQSNETLERYYSI